MAMHPLAEKLLRGMAQAGAKALGSAMHSVLEDIGGVAEGVASRTKQGRERLEQVGVGRPPKTRRRARKHRDEDDEQE